MISRELKEKALELRKNSESYSSIKEKTGIAIGMLSYWFSRHEWSRKISEANSRYFLADSKNRIIEINKKRAITRANKYKKVENDAEVEFHNFKNETLFSGALMLYLGEGSKSLFVSTTRISNTDPAVLKIFINFLKKYCHIQTESIKFWLLSYPDLDANMCLSWWGKELGLNDKNFYKTQVIQGKHKTKRLLYGVGNIIISSKVLKIKILKWIELTSKELS